jgi:transcription-repair coupling factor (superfamily II helicase)
VNPLLQRFLAELDGALGGAEGLARARGGGLPYAIAAFLAGRTGSVGILVPTEASARKLHGFLRAVLGDRGAPLLLPAPDADPYEGLPNHPGILLERAQALATAALSPRPAVLVGTGSLLWKVPRRGVWTRYLLQLEEGRPLDRRAFRSALWKVGYRQADLVAEPGDAAFRGGIIDVFSPNETLPIRLELFGDDVDSLRFFDPSTQHSLGSVGRPVLVPPLSEALRDEALQERLRMTLSREGEFGEIRQESLSQIGTYPTYDAEVRQDPEFFSGLPEFLEGASWVAVEPEACAQNAKVLLDQWAESHHAHRRPPFLAPDRLFLGAASVRALTADPRTLRAGSGEGPGAPSERPPLFPGEPYKFLAYIKERIAEGFRCIALLQGQGTLDRLAEMAMADGLSILREVPQGGDLTPGFYAALVPAEEGVIFPAAHWLAVTEKELFGRGRAALPEARVQHREAFFSGLRDLKPGAPVVHMDHGVGLFQGIETLVREGLTEDYLVLAYAGGGRLLVPVQRMDLIQKYVGPEGHGPPLDRLGGPAWKKTKDKVRRAVQEIAGDLLKLYARRRTVEGWTYGPDTAWQLEFESQFPFDLTPDQTRAVEDIKRDMESPKPMDRLVCGDVGFGKTEVAMRAAFKAVQDGRQVMVLCPTTVLALQHQERFAERFAPFPVTVKMLSRFVSAKEQKAIAAAANLGKVDILVGTHRLLSKDVKPPDLGLLVVDEEQRFGVTHKEKIKQLKTHVDVLTLTATPIPRTLQMGLSGMVDMSLIQTPPKDRLAIQTSVHAFERELIRSALHRELSRGGQVYYVHNQVETIAAAARRLQEWVPEARVTIAHGQMGERALEEVMLAFFHGHYDVLVCTTIIENGVDLSRANTLIVNNAHAFGLCQLYQLRGRIGRSDVPAYAYLLVPPGLVLQPDAEKRLATLQEFSELGAGFRVAAVDLELRGAGNLLGAEQSGHIESVGFDLYLRLLEEAVSEAKGEAALAPIRCEMNLGMDLAVPADYIEDQNQRLTLYREISLASGAGDVARIASDLSDRFGPAPPVVSRMLDAVRLRLKAERLSIRSVSRKDDRIHMTFDPEAPLDTAGLVRFLSSRKGVLLSPSGSLVLALERGEDVLALVGRVLNAAAPGEAPA